MKNLSLTILLLLFFSSAFGKALIDRDVVVSKNTQALAAAAPLSLIVFLHSSQGKQEFIEDISKFPDVTIQELGFMPAVAVRMPANQALLDEVANHHAVAQISSYHSGTQELDITTQAIKLAPSSYYPNVKNWWANGYTGAKGIIGLIDDGVDPDHPILADKHLKVRKEDGSRYSDYQNGVRTAHGTGIACIYSSTDPQYKGIAYGAKTIISGLSGEETADMPNIMLSLSTLDWMLKRSGMRPTIINYSMGNGTLSCPNCPEWSGLAKVIDFVVNHEKILWVKSAGNEGFVEPTQHVPFASKLTVPSDNYNALTIANMDTVVYENGLSYKTPNREQHTIHSTSSRGPTPFGRRKPDLSAPGFATRTCAPDPRTYGFNYPLAMDYHEGFRLMGGTSSAAPHVGASALLVQDAGIQNPMAVKALLINSADAWSDNGTAKPFSGSIANHFSVMGSEWNRTYGWGYLNMQKAFEQRMNIIESQLSAENPVQEFTTRLDIGEKITLVHERRVGYFKDSTEWRLSHLSLEIFDLATNKLIAKDDSPIDTVHQVANCIRPAGQKGCSSATKAIRARVRVKLLNPTIDGSPNEPFALVLKIEK
ncbi:MAG: S8 family serine peptidase [Tatlockia sp.]|nr:S8 family serine peptidase [Tatlockia sp.]